VEEAELVARAAGLSYVSDASPGISRVRRGTGFSYVGVDGRPEAWLRARTTERATRAERTVLSVLQRAAGDLLLAG